MQQWQRQPEIGWPNYVKWPNLDQATARVGGEAVAFGHKNGIEMDQGARDQRINMMPDANNNDGGGPEISVQGAGSDARTYNGQPSPPRAGAKRT